MLLKMHDVAVIIFVNLFMLTSGHGINYCGSKMCGYTNAHTFCQFAAGPSHQCIGYIPAALTPIEKTRILARLNRRRDDTAGGKLRRFSSAGNMLKLRWIDELAREAQLWADQCRPPKTPEEHDACRDLYSITVGQCVASVVGEAPGLRVESMVDIWFMQHIHYKGNVTLYEPPNSNKHFYGDFGQIIWARTYMVGCGRSRFMISFNGRFRTIERLVCNFAPQGPALYRPLWSPGAPATACPSRSRPYSGLNSLCDYQNELNQPKDIDNSMTLEEHILLNAVLEMERNETEHGSLDEIYLTYLALVTMQYSDVTTAHYNSMQKRDLVEKMNNGTRVTQSDYAQFSNITTELQTVKNATTKLPKKKVKIIGRPKTYNMEELSDIGGNQKEENHDKTEAMSKHKREFYYDYIIGISEENLTTEQINTEKDLNENTASVDHTLAMIPSANITILALLNQPKSIINTTKYEGNTIRSTVTPNFINITAAYNESLTGKDRIMDEYLSDPETVRQLQEALDRMERQANGTPSTGKIRLDVRDASSVSVSDASNGITHASDSLDEGESSVEEDNAHASSDSFILLSDSHDPTTILPEENQNKSLERVPVLNMMMQYMPYLKNVENNLRTRNSASCVFPSVVLMMIVRFH